jgi:nitrite reductase/ring-hydroxylating ferredoxin subunit
MATFVKVASTTDLQPGTGKTVEVGEKSIAIFNVHGKYHAIDNTCAHRGGPLGEGMLDGNIVTCPWHGWQWDVSSGKTTFNSAISVKCYPVEVDGTDIKIAVD